MSAGGTQDDELVAVGKIDWQIICRCWVCSVTATKHSKQQGNEGNAEKIRGKESEQLGTAEGTDLDTNIGSLTKFPAKCPSQHKRKKQF